MSISDSHDNHLATAELLVSIGNTIRFASTMYLECENAGNCVLPVTPKVKLLGLLETLNFVNRVSEEKCVYCALPDQSSVFCGQKFAIKYEGAGYSSDLHHLLRKEEYAFNALIKIRISMHCIVWMEEET